MSSSSPRRWPPRTPPSRPPRPQSLELVSSFHQFGGHELRSPRSPGVYGQPHVSGLPTHKEGLGENMFENDMPKRRGFHPFKLLVICMKGSCKLSMVVNGLWPIVPVAFLSHYILDRDSLGNFILPYIAMLPCANLLGFAGRELAMELPRVVGVLVETTFGSIVEFILLVILIRNGIDFVPVVQAAILGSILANLLLCLGLCLFAGGLKRTEQVSHEAISETGTSLMLVAGMGLVLPAMFSVSATEEVTHKVLEISRGTSIMLLIAYLLYVFFQMRSHHSLYDDIFRMEQQHKKAGKERLTIPEALVAVVLGIVCVSFMAYYLVDHIPWIVAKRHIKDAFVGLIMIPLVEKAAEHITAIDEAYEGHLNSAMAHVLGSSIQTALLNTPLVVIIAWGMKIDMNLNFQIFDAATLILAIIVVGNFLHHRRSNWLEGALCVIVYICLAIAAFYYPNDPEEESALERHHRVR